MKIAILYICTGRYDVFWKSFYISSEKYFIKMAEKTYYVFTDTDTLYNQDDNHVKKIYQENLGWPGNTLFRFKIFAKYADELRDYDYVFFINANMLFTREISTEILPEKGLVVTKHPAFWNKKRKKFTYENNPDSLAYIGENEGEFYVCGGFNGGTGEAYTRMILDLAKAIDEDYAKNIVAVWHDESHLNKYILSHHCKILDPSYAYPEGWNKKLPFECKIMIRDKEKYGGHAFLRQESNVMISKEKCSNKQSKWEKIILNIKKCLHLVVSKNIQLF